MPDIRVLPDLDAVSRAAADELIELVPRTVAARGAFHIALSGGSTPKRLFKELVTRARTSLPWNKIHVYWGDERSVPPWHADSNYGMAKSALLDPVRIDYAKVRRMHGEASDLDAAATVYECDLAAVMTNGTPVFDYVMLGMGPDGHCASLFPNTRALDVTDRWVVANPVDSPVAKGKTTRLTFTARTINAGRNVRFLIAGADKADALAHVLQGPRDPHRYPSQLVQPTSGSLVWFVDAAAAAQLQGGPS
ncbi:MAG TPA: 6-phosphogluconolactonase [Kofleriaceae bacterium]|nr:6-phosphogluconolactonase [Kofleriaceae bacterium]